jgi:GTPase SAR1 family protein
MTQGGSGTNSSEYVDDMADLVVTTPFINVEKVFLPHSNDQCIIYDLSGQGRYREQWQFFYPDVDGIFYVVDSTDLDRVSVN